MQFVSIPHFQIEEKHQKELIDSIKKTKESLETYYSKYLTNVKRTRAAKEVENFEKDLLPILITDGDTLDNRPNICFPWIKAVGNSLEAELEKAIFTPGFLTWIPSDPNLQYMVEDLTDAFDFVREQSGTDDQESQIITNCVYDGTVPVIITNRGRFNSVHEIVPTYEAEISDDVRHLLNAGFVYDAHQKMFDIPEPDRTMLASTLPLDVGSKVVFHEEDVQTDEDQFTGIRLVSETGFELQRFTDDEETGVSALEQAHQFLQSLGIDIRRIKIIDQQVKTTEKWIEGLPRPEVKDILRTFIVPPDEDSNPDTYKFVSCDWVKTQTLIDNPDYINKEKLLNQDGKPIGTTNVNQKESDNTKKSSNASYEASDLMVETRTAYFDHFRFEDGTELRNFIVTTVSDKILIECRPNVGSMETAFGKVSKSPLIVTTFNKNFNENIGTSPSHDLLDLAKYANILVNWALDNLSRNGGQWAYFTDMVDIKTANGGTATMVEVDGEEARQKGIKDVRHAYNKIEGNVQDTMAAFQATTVVKDQMHSVASAAPHPYMQSNPQETATQAGILASQANAITGKISRHITRCLTEIYQRMLDDLIQRGVKVDKVPYYDNESKQTYFKTFDFGELRGKNFVPKITSVTPALNKQVQLNILKEIIQMLVNNPQNPELHSKVSLSEVIQEFFKNTELDNPNLVREDKAAQEEMMRINQKEAIFNAVATGQYILQPNPAAGAQQQQQLQQGSGSEDNTVA